MKKLFIGLISMFTILAGTSAVAVASSNNAKNLNCRFIENNTLVVTAPSLTESRIYTKQGLLIEKASGAVAMFELQQGEYLLFADVDNETIFRKVILK